MSDDLELAALLGEAPAAPDPVFRYDVFTNMAERARRRHARMRAWRIVMGFTLIGACFPAGQWAGLTLSNFQPMLAVTAVLTAAGVVALLTIRGPGVVLAYSRAILSAR
ncbi:MAG: hypothetical protein J0L81_13235 [Caulobacterales bacterium]|jgi:cobalamin biosynthesis protein CobD/CbiB|nr:hypothetical protein [Caulobacterales bacterium]